MLRTVTLGLLLLLVGCFSSAAAAPLRLRDTGLAGFARGDGVRYLAVTADQHPVTVLDVVTQARRTIPAPAPDCRLSDIHRATLLWNCQQTTPSAKRGVTYDLSTGALGSLESPQPPLNSGADFGTYRAIGTHWAQAAFTAYRQLGAMGYVQRFTGEQRILDPSSVGRNRIVDLDAPSLTRKLCSGQRRPYVGQPDGTTVGLGDLAFAGRWAAATTLPGPESRGGGGTSATVELQRCGTKPRALTICDCSQPVINGKIVAWIQRGGSKRFRLVLRSLRTGRTRATKVMLGSFTPVLVGDRLYLTSSGSGAIHVLSADL